jgi:kinetochore complex Sim4 subunit Fta1
VALTWTMPHRHASLVIRELRPQNAWRALALAAVRDVPLLANSTPLNTINCERMRSLRGLKMRRKEAPDAYPLYQSTFSVSRVSPLYHGKTPLLSNLNLHARRLRNAVSGDSMQAIQIALAAVHTASSSGTLQSCVWSLLADEESWETAHAALQDEEDEISGLLDVNPRDAVGIHVELKYEKVTYSAVLLGNANHKTDVSGFTTLPLLLLKMPAELRQLFLNYLSTTFDARVLPMKLRPHFLSSVIEHVLDSTVTVSDSDLDVDVSAFPKGLQLQLSIPSVAPQLKNIDISLNQDDLAAFIRQGQQLWDDRSYNMNQTHMEGLAPVKSPVTGPFTASLSHYLAHHLALNFEHPAVVLDKVAMGQFAFGSEGRVKVLSSSSESQEIWRMLLQEAQRQRILDKDEVLKQPEAPLQRKSTAIPSERSSRIPTEPPPPYTVHDPAFPGDIG